MSATKGKGLAVASGQAPEQSTRNDLDCATGAREDKAFRTLQAQFALAGHTLQRTNPQDGRVTYYASRWGLVRHLEDLEHAQQFLRQIGG